MKHEILLNLNNPAQLERLYRSDKTTFKRNFNMLQPQIQNSDLVSFWNERLNFSKEEINWGSRNELLLVVVAASISALIAKFSQIFSINEEFFYQRNIGFIVFPVLAVYFSWKHQLSKVKITAISLLFIVSSVFINSLPPTDKSDTSILSCIHLILFLWAILSFAYVGEIKNNYEKRLSYLKYNGDLVVMTTLILIAGAILSAITVGLFSLIGFNIGEFYFQNVAISGLAAAPVIATYLIQTNPQLVGKVSPVIAKIFSPLVVVMLLIYLGAIIYSGKDPYNDRDFLLIFNALLIGVMAIIFFSVAETSRTTKSQAETWILFLLCAITIIVNGIALSAILFRISEWGITPNRGAVLGGNILILTHLLLVTVRLYHVLKKKTEISSVGKMIASYLPVYIVWTVIVTFIFPVLFGFK